MHDLRRYVHPATLLIRMALALGLALPGCGRERFSLPIEGVYRMDSSTLPESGVARPDQETEDLIATLAIILQESELTLHADGTYEWKSLFLRDQKGRWDRVGDVVTMQPAGESDEVVSALSLQVGEGTLTLIPDNGQEPSRSDLVFRKQ